MSNDYITPDRAAIQTHLHVCFSYLDGLIPLRSFAEKGTGRSVSACNIWIKADDQMAKNAMEFAMKADNVKAGCYMIPGIVANIGEAGSAHVIAMQSLLIDIDSGDTRQKLELLTGILGNPTLIVESGGVIDEFTPKLHIYWQLTKPAVNQDLNELLRLRYKIALSVGGDIHFKSAHQPIRIAGSVYHKNNANKLVKIKTYSLVEYELEELIAKAKLLPEPVSANRQSMSTDQLMVTKIPENGEGEHTRFNHIRRVAGFWIRRCFDGIVTKERAIEEISSYNLANVKPAWDQTKLQQTIDSLWQLHQNKLDGFQLIARKFCNKDKANPICSYSLGAFLCDDSKMPNDLIAPRILTPGGIFVFGGAPKIGKSDFLLSLLVHMAAGQDFNGLCPPRALKIFYLQAEIGYYYLRERLQNMQLSAELMDIARENLFITPNTALLLNAENIGLLSDHIIKSCNTKPDIIAIDPIRNVFDGGNGNAKENDNDAMLFFLQKRVETLRNNVNPDAGIILVHHTKKLSTQQLEEDPFQAFSGASSLRGYYSTGAILYKPNDNGNHGNNGNNHDQRKLVFELRNGEAIAPKILNKQNGRWVMCDDTKSSKIRELPDIETRVDLIISLLESEGANSRFYMMQQFAERFANYKILGSTRSVYDDCSYAASSGHIRFFNNPVHYNLNITVLKGYGLMCTRNMVLHCNGQSIKIFPTHYKCDGKKIKVKEAEYWKNLSQLEVENEQ